MSNLKYLKNDYVPTGKIKNFPLAIIDRMIEEQVRQGNEPDVTVFESKPDAHKVDGGFAWSETADDFDFWSDVINWEDFNMFFERYPKSELTFPRVIEVRNSDENNWVKRVCIMFKNGEAICWVNAETIEESEREVQTSHWSYWREVQEEEEVKLDNSWSEWSEEIENKRYCDPFNFSKGIEDYADLMGKTIVHKDGNKMLVINELFYDDVNGLSSINEIETKFLFENYTFIDGSPVGVSYKGLNKFC